MPEVRQSPPWFVIGLTLGAVVIVAGTILALRQVVPPPSSPVELPPLPEVAPAGGTIRVEPPGGSGLTPPGAPLQIIEPVEGDPNPIRYTGQGFAPIEKTIRLSDALGCLLTMVNDAREPLRVGVSPHADAGDPGADYGVILPGESQLLDVRYPGLSAIALHNHAIPAHSFRVTYGTGCQ